VAKIEKPRCSGSGQSIGSVANDTLLTGLLPALLHPGRDDLVIPLYEPKLKRKATKKPVAKAARKLTRKRKPRPPTQREQAILGLPRPSKMGLQAYCERTTIPLPSHWAKWLRPRTYLAAYESKDPGLRDLIKNERKNAWTRRDDGLI